MRLPPSSDDGGAGSPWSKRDGASFNGDKATPWTRGRVATPHAKAIGCAARDAQPLDGSRLRTEVTARGILAAARSGRIKGAVMSATWREVMGTRRGLLLVAVAASAVVLGGCVGLQERHPGVADPHGQVGAAHSADGGHWSVTSATVAGSVVGLQVYPLALSFGWDQPELQFTLTNAGDRPLYWSAGVEGNSPWLRLSHRLGLLNPGESTLVTVLVNRSGLVPGSYLDRIFVVSDVGQVVVVPVSTSVSLPYAGPIILRVAVQSVQGTKVTLIGEAGCRGGIITRMTVAWGDGRMEDYLAPSFPITHTYPHPGAYPVTVTVYSSTGHQRSGTLVASTSIGE